MDEISPILQEIARHPIAFLGGFASGLLRLNLNDEPVKSWLDKRTGSPLSNTQPMPGQAGHNGSGPQSISID